VLTVLLSNTDCLRVWFKQL